MTDYVAVLQTNYPDAQWSLSGNDYVTLQWYDDTPKPTQAELDAAWPTVEYNNQVAAVEQARAPTTKRPATRCSSSGNEATEPNKPGSTPSPPSKPPTHTRRPHDRHQRRR